MSEITVDIETARQLFGSTRPVVIRDRGGKNLGTFVPSETFVQELYDWAKAEFAKEESQRTSPVESGSPIDEVWQRIEHAHGAG